MAAEQMNILLPSRMAKFIRGKVKVSEYTNACEVVRYAIRPMQASEDARRHRARRNAFEGEDDAARTGIQEGVAATNSENASRKARFAL